MQAVYRAGWYRLAVFCILLGTGCLREPQDRPGPEVDPRRLAPDFTIGPTPPDGFHLRNLRGKVVVLSFAIGNLSSDGEQLHTLLVNMSRVYPRDRLAIIEVDRMGETDETGPVKPDTSFYHLSGRQDIYARYGVKRLPTLVILDRAGREVFRHEGFHPQSTGIKAFKDKVAGLLRS